MPALTEYHKKVLAPLIKPFQRSQTKTIENDLLTGEESNEPFLNFIHDGIENKPPIGYVEITEEELELHQILNYRSFPEKCFLWVIDDTSIKIMWELTSNVLRSESNPKKPYVCHTNITGCKEAYIGGEMYFCTNGNIYINFKSDRYGSVDVNAKMKMAKEYMGFVNYKNVLIIGE